MKKYLMILVIFGLLLMNEGCEFSQLDNPNEITEKLIDPDKLLVNIYVRFADFYQNFQKAGGMTTRVYGIYGYAYEEVFHPNAMNDLWPYHTLLINIHKLKDLAIEKKLNKHLAIAKTLEAYIVTMLIDAYGDIPYHQSFDPKNLNPENQSGQELYGLALEWLKEAEDEFGKSNSFGSPVDFFYKNDYEKWAKLSRAFQLKLYLNLRLIDPQKSRTGIQELIKEGLPEEGDEFVFRYGTSNYDPDTQHPDFKNYSDLRGYQSNYFLYQITQGKSAEPGKDSVSVDPRASYYFYRQIRHKSNQALGCWISHSIFPNNNFCLPTFNGYYGQNHLDPIFFDGFAAWTLYGVYPGGGHFDKGLGLKVYENQLRGSSGAGIQPMMLPAYVDFMLSEAAFSLQINGMDAKEYLISAIKKHMDFVRSWALTTDQSHVIRNHIKDSKHKKDVAIYTDIIRKKFDTSEDKLDLIAHEYWLSCNGAGFEAYNLYKRTGRPKGLQNPITNTTYFPRTFMYPSIHVERNSKVKQKLNNGIKVFWDTNPDYFIR